MGRIVFVVIRKWSPQTIFCQFRSSRIDDLLRLDSNKPLKVVEVYVSTTAIDEDEIEEFYSKLESTLAAKSTCTVVMVTSVPIVGSGESREEAHWQAMH